MSPANRLNQIIDEQKISKREFAERVGVSENQVRKLFKTAEKQLRSGTHATRRAIIDQYINKILVFPDRIEIYMNLTDDYTIKETIQNK